MNFLCRGSGRFQPCCLCSPALTGSNGGLCFADLVLWCLSQSYGVVRSAPIKLQAALAIGPKGSVQGRVGWSSEQPGLVEDVPAHGRGVGTRWSLRSLPTWTVLWFYGQLVSTGASLLRGASSESTAWPTYMLMDMQAYTLLTVLTSPHTSAGVTALTGQTQNQGTWTSFQHKPRLQWEGPDTRLHWFFC